MDVLACPHCLRMFHARPAIMGKRIRCRGCRETFQLPADTASAEFIPEGSPTSGEAAVPLAIAETIDGLDTRRCPACGRGFAMRAGLAGKTIRCRGCRSHFRVAAPAARGPAFEPGGWRSSGAEPPPRFQAPPAPAGRSPAMTPSARPTIFEDSGDVLEEVAGERPVRQAMRPRTLRPPSFIERAAPVLAVVLGGLTAVPVAAWIIWLTSGADPLGLVDFCAGWLWPLADQ